MALERATSFYPTNKHLLLQPIVVEEKKKEKKTSILLPEDYKEKDKKEEQYKAYNVISVAIGSSLQVAKDKKVVVDNSMVQVINVDGQVYHLVHENYVIGVFV